MIDNFERFEKVQEFGFGSKLCTQWRNGQLERSPTVVILNYRCTRALVISAFKAQKAGHIVECFTKKIATELGYDY